MFHRMDHCSYTMELVHLVHYTCLMDLWLFLFVMLDLVQMKHKWFVDSLVTKIWTKLLPIVMPSEFAVVRTGCFDASQFDNLFIVF